MTEIARELLEGIQIGDYVQVRYGTDSYQTEYEGTVEKWSENFLSLRESNGELTRIRLDDNLRTLKKVQKGLVRSKDPRNEPLSSTNIGSTTPQIATPNQQVFRQMVSLPLARPYSTTPTTCIEEAKKHLKNAESAELKKSLNGVLASLSAAIKAKDINNKYHNLRARILSNQDACASESDFYAFYYTLGTIAFVASDYEYSIEPLVRANEYLFASYSASLGNLTESAQVLTLCALLSKESKDVNQFISEILLERRDVKTLKKLLDDNKDDPEMCEKLATCSMMLFSSSGSSLPSIISPYLSAYETAVQLISAIPADWQVLRSAVSWWNEFSEYSYQIQDAKEQLNDDIVSVIKKFDIEKKYGFIDKNHYFYITQVCDDSERGILLRKMLSLGLGSGLEVVFRLGKSQTTGGKTAATAIELTSKGYDDALERVAKANQPAALQKGFIEEYFPRFSTGRIQSLGKKYLFKIESIIDPWLRAYYEECFSPQEQDVTFEVNGNNACNISWLNPDNNTRDMYASSVKDIDIEKLNKYLSKRNDTSSTVLPDEDPFAEYKYRDLPAIDDTILSSEELLTWSGKSIISQNSDNSNKVSKTTSESKPIATNKPPVRPTITGKEWADRGRKAMLQGSLDEAGYAFEQALRIDGFNEAVVCDYISLCMRREETINKAVELLNTYEKRFSPGKLMNLKIQVYDKKHDYSMLSELYEEAFLTATSVSKKSHFLFRLIDAYIKLGKYSEALSTCKRWEQFYSQNRFSADADKIKNAEPGIRRQKAVCLYNLGETDEAKRIATDLLRANPADTIANSIIDDTLVKNGSEGATEISTDSFPETEIDSLDDEMEDEDASDSQMSRFVRKLVQEIDIAASLKTPYIKDGKYTGTSNNALDDVRKLAGGMRGMRRSAKTRSDSLLAACKLLDQIEQREDGTIKNPYYKYRLTGRAMASWGDYMVSQVGQLDTTRMAYLYALRILTPTQNGAEQDWINSYNRYIKSFFLARVGVKSLDEYIVQQTNSPAKDKPNADILVDNRIQDVLIPEFTVGVIMIIKSLLAQQEWVDTFVEDLFTKNNELRLSIIHQLERILNKSIDKDINLHEFKKILLQVVELFDRKNSELHGIITDLSNVVFSQLISESDLAQLNSDYWKNFITATDVARLTKLVYILKRTQDYFASGDFENRSDCLRAVSVEVRDLLHAIQKEPTDISFDVFLPALEQISLRVNDKQTNLYQDFLPRLSWRETIQPFKTPDGQIQVQLTVENELNYQSADSLSISTVNGTDIEWFDCGTVIQTLRGGDEAEIGINIAVKESAVSSGSFVATIGYTYKCNDSPQNSIVKNQEIEFTFIIRNENFEPLKNPYSPYEGKVMDDDTMFVGRSTQIQQILDMICPNADGVMNYGRAIAMYGQTRTGKSSLMYHIKKKLMEKYEDDVLIWDIGNIGELEESSEFMANFLYNLLYIGSEAIYDNDSVSTIVEEEGLLPPLDGILNTPSFAVTLFNEYMKKLNVILQKEKKIIVLLVDEFTYLHGYINAGKIPVSFMRFWKALLQNYCIFAIVAGQDDMPEFMREYQNEFACMELLKVNYLDERDAKQLIQRPLEIVNGKENLFKSDGSIHKLYSLTAGSTYLTIIICSKLVSYLNEKGAYIITKGIVNEFLRTRAFGPNGFLTEVHFEAQLQERGHRELDDINKTILLSVARLSQTTGYANINDIVCNDLNREEIQKYVDRLVDRNVLVKEGRDQYWIQVKLLELWLIKSMGE